MTSRPDRGAGDGLHKVLLGPVASAEGRRDLGRLRRRKLAFSAASLRRRSASRSLRRSMPSAFELVREIFDDLGVEILTTEWKVSPLVVFTSKTPSPT